MSMTEPGTKPGTEPRTARSIPDQPGFCDACAQRTRDLHRAAERSGILRAVFAGRADRLGYASLLRNLLAVYQTLEAALDRASGHPVLGLLPRAGIDRTPAIAADLEVLCGPDWRALALLPAGAGYARHIATLGRGDPERLLAHAYVRYLGDLNGGQILARRLEVSLGPRASALSFHRFPASADPADLRACYRAALDRAGAELADPAAVIEEAAAAFAWNIALSDAVAAALPPADPAPPAPAAGP